MIETLAGQFSEAAVAHQLAELLPDNGQLFVGNSLIVRLIDALGQLPAGYPVYSNRGGQRYRWFAVNRRRCTARDGETDISYRR